LTRTYRIRFLNQPPRRQGVEAFMRITKTALTLVAFSILAGCSGSSQSIQIDPRIHMVAEFCDDRWNGQEIPVEGRCGDCGGEGLSPELRISGLTAEVDEVTIAFNDLRIPDLAKNGGHGTLGIATAGRAEIILPSVREETMSLPRGVRSVHKHRCVFYGHKAGAYKAPCGCGYGNEYVAVVKAISRNGEKSIVLAQKEIRLGFF